jgi:DnaJ homolog subfamily C member 19
MVFLLLGGASLVVLMAVLGVFSKAQVATIKSFGIWFVAIGGLLLATLLFFTGRGGTAIAALVMLGPLVWSWLKEAERPAARRGRAAAAKPGGGPMSVDEAYSVLGLQPGADADAIRDAHRRLMRMAHPDTGGSDWLATRINQARDVLLG